MKLVSARELRARIADWWLPGGDAPSDVGAVRLHAHQQSAVSRLRAILDEHRGALLADEAGLGKSYVAAAIMRDAKRPLLVLPASLRAMWRDALRTAGVSATVVSYTLLSRGTLPAGEFDLIVLDEAHHARTPSTLRYAALASLAARSRMLLLSATPVHNRRAELAALFALFLGARAYAWSDAELAKLIVRRERGDVASAVAIPEAPAPEWIPVTDDAPVLDAVLALPAPLPPSDGGTGGVLLTWSLLRQWASSRAALVGALRRRIARGVSLESALEEGHYPDRRELRAWSAAEDAVQLAFPQLMAAPAAAPHALLIRVREHLAAVRALLARLRADGSADAARAQSIRELCAKHAGEKVLVFSQYADTVHALFAELRGAPGVASLTARGGRIASGRLSRQETLERFAPRASGSAAPAGLERIDLLIATDLASEGLNLHDASVIVHADLPWTPARLEQRVARSRRLGALHARTHSYAFAPPASAERVLEVERRLRAKLRTMEEVLGSTGAVLPSGESVVAPVAAGGESGSAKARESIDRAVRRWSGEGWGPLRADYFSPAGLEGELLMACVASPERMVLALAIDASEPVLAAGSDGSELSEDASVVLRALDAASGADAALDPRAITDAVGSAERWLARRSGAAASGALAWRGTSRRLALRRIAGMSARTPHHRRALLAPLAIAARRIVTAPYALGAEQVLDEIASAPLPDEAWLRALTSFGAMHGGREREASAARLLAVIVTG